MKNLKKLSRIELKKVTGGSEPYYDPVGGYYCPRHMQLCEVNCKPTCVDGPCLRSLCIGNPPFPDPGLLGPNW